MSVPVSSLPLRRFDRVEFDRLVDLGWFADEPVQLIEGMLVTMSPQGAGHAWVIERFGRLLSRALDPAEYAVRIQLPLAVSGDSEPEPDIAVTAPSSPEAHPTTALVVVEVAQTSHALDLGVKVGVFAAAGVDLYCVVDLLTAEVIVHQHLADGHYTQIRRLGRDDTLRLLDVEIPLGEILP